MARFTVTVTLPDGKAAALQDSGSGLRASIEDVLVAAIKVGLTDWAAVECELIVNPSDQSDSAEPFLPDGGRRLRAMLDLNRAQADLVEELAEWDGVGVSEFLNRCLASGIHHAHALMQAEDEKALRGEAPSSISPSGTEDDIPF